MIIGDMFNEFSRLMLGTWGLSGDWNANRDEVGTRKNAKDVIACAAEYGINQIDTAAVYGRGLIESVIGELPGRYDLIVASKVPAIIKPVGNLYPNEAYYTEDHIRRVTSEMLKRLKRDNVDILQLHNWHSEWDSQAVYFLAPLSRMKGTGEVRYVGVSLPDNYNGDLEKILQLGILDFVQLPYNPLQDWANFNLLSYYKVLPLVRSTYCQGLISPKLEYPESISHPMSSRYNLSVLREKTRVWIEQAGGSWDDVNKILLSRTFNSMGRSGAVIIGMNNVDRVRQNVDLMHELESNC